MRVRTFANGDQQAIAQIHAEMGLDYKMPDLGNAMVAGKSVCEEDGTVIAAAAIKYQAEAYLWIQPGIHPAKKWDAIRLMQRDLIGQALKLGIQQIVAYVPDCVRFGKRMKMLRWIQPRDGWTTWVYEVKP